MDEQEMGEKMAREMGEKMAREQDRDQKIFEALVSQEGCGLIASAMTAAADTGDDPDEPKTMAFIAIKMFGLAACADEGGEEIKSVIDRDNPWMVTFGASKQQILGLIDVLQQGADFLVDIDEVRAIDDIGDIDTGEGE